MIEGFYAIDYQVHSFCSHDGRAAINDHCLRAIELGLDEIGFSEHKDFDPEDPVVNYFDYDRYKREVEQARRNYGSQLKIRAGVEIDYQNWFENEIADYLESHEFDFVIGSVHYVDRQMVMTPEYNLSRTRHQAYTDYFRAISDSVKTGLFDILGHLEYANRRGVTAWGPYRTEDYEDEIQEICAALLKYNTALEINTAGLHQNIGLTYPTLETASIYAQMGGKLLSIGSDAHHPDQLAYSYSTPARDAISIGLENVCTWHKRECSMIPIQLT